MRAINSHVKCALETRFSSKHFQGISKAFPKQCTLAAQMFQIENLIVQVLMREQVNKLRIDTKDQLKDHRQDQKLVPPFNRTTCQLISRFIMEAGEQLAGQEFSWHCLQSIAQQFRALLHISIRTEVQKSPSGRTPSLLAINSTFSVSAVNAEANCQKGNDDTLDEQLL